MSEETKSNYRIAKEAFADTAAKLDAATEWIKSMGINVHSSRIGIWKKHINGLSDAWNENKINDYINRIRSEDIHTSISEGIEFIKIYEELQPLAEERIKDKIRKITKGPFLQELEIDSNSSNIGRNTIFELNVCSRLLSSGTDIDISGLADVAFPIESNTIFLECKRPKTIESLPNAFKDARKQLIKRFKQTLNSQNHYGFIAISLSQLLEAGQEIIIAKNSDAMSIILSKIMSYAIDVLKLSFHYRPVKRIVGVFLHFLTAGLIESEGLPLSMQQTGYYALCPPNTKEHRIFEQVISKLENGYFDGNIFIRN